MFMAIVLSLVSFISISLMDEAMKKKTQEDLAFLSRKLVKTGYSIYRDAMRKVEEIKEKEKEIKRCKEMRGMEKYMCVKNLRRRMEEIEKEYEREFEHGIRVAHRRIRLIYK
ncbi:MAG: hypothetical protein DSY42_01110 [Aquifex sp.]|nr:MAG: hypothetical protein DSY42_01110 [Aquifex sp.]